MTLARPTSPRISRERAAKAALGVIDVGGLDAMSVSAVARRLGVKGPSLYYHFKDKNAILAEVARLILMEATVPGRGAEEPWDDWIVRLAVSVRRSILEHPNAAPLLLHFFPRYLLLVTYNNALRYYRVPLSHQLMAVEGLEKLTFGSALFAAAARSRNIEPMPNIDSARFPHLTAAVRHNPYDEQAMFSETVRAFLRGLPRIPTEESLRGAET